MLQTSGRGVSEHYGNGRMQKKIRIHQWQEIRALRRNSSPVTCVSEWRRLTSPNEQDRQTANCRYQKTYILLGLIVYRLSDNKIWTIHQEKENHSANHWENWISRWFLPLQLKFTSFTAQPLVKAGLHVRRKRKKKERALVLASSWFTCGLCLYWRRTCKPVLTVSPLMQKPSREGLHLKKANQDLLSASLNRNKVLLMLSRWRIIPTINLSIVLCSCLLSLKLHALVTAMVEKLSSPTLLKSDQYQISPAASPEIYHQTVRKICLFMAYSDDRWSYYQFSLLHPYIFSLEVRENVLFELSE